MRQDILVFGIYQSTDGEGNTLLTRNGMKRYEGHSDRSLQGCSTMCVLFVDLSYEYFFFGMKTATFNYTEYIDGFKINLRFRPGRFKKLRNVIWR